ncbi:hypothetical protein [Rivibacter subsaxonicus]|uniref:Lipoprotein n=1 Tax=Rivibacter subsaxonicus TaxID=457575 RepID=A0A4V6MEP1_9BURK|nr:hypothetical protein [Rivibacter subsaxonicus]RZU00546.1 hypothetical protein EV670_1256 [Rivibacter subsaxonicus]
MSIPVPAASAPLALMLALLAACTPTLDWREVRPTGSKLVALFPCKPERVTRALPLAGAEVQFELLACSADGSTWALSSADLGDPGRVAAALDELRRVRVLNLDGRETASAPFVLRGATPHPGALRFEVTGRRPDGTAVGETSVVFAQGTRVFHAAVLGAAPAAAVQNFIDGLKLPG